jgi:hypothetical protein
VKRPVNVDLHHRLVWDPTEPVPPVSECAQA